MNFLHRQRIIFRDTVFSSLSSIYESVGHEKASFPTLDASTFLNYKQ